MPAPSLRRPAAWLLAALLTVVAGVGEGLHQIPGFGHGVMVGERALLLGPMHSAPLDAYFPQACCVGGLSGQSIPVLEEDDCPICQLLGVSFAPPLEATMPAAEVQPEWLPTGSAVTLPFETASYRARAPPIAVAPVS